MKDVVFITGEDCHLCEHGRGVLDRLAIERREISVTSPEAEAFAGRGVPLSFLPVLVEDGRLIAYGRLSEKRLRKESQR